VLPFFAASVPLPPNTPIPCLICRSESAPTLTFSGTVQLAQADRLRVFNGKTHQTMGFIVPAEFHGVESSDGTIKAGPVSRAAPGLLARVTYRADGGRNEVTRVVLLTINQCRELMAAEHLNDTRNDCPD
jgi:hypothetical protein